MSRVVELLEETLALIEGPGRWTTGWFARNADGDVTWPCDGEARSWCVLGALERCSSHDDMLTIGEAKSLLWEASSGRSPAIVNDGGGHEAVMEVLRLAIARARAAQPQGVGNA